MRLDTSKMTLNLTMKMVSIEEKNENIKRTSKLFEGNESLDKYIFFSLQLFVIYKNGAFVKF